MAAPPAHARGPGFVGCAIGYAGGARFTLYAVRRSGMEGGGAAGVALAPTLERGT
jgi:hypothetical protein